MGRRFPVSTQCSEGLKREENKMIIVKRSQAWAPLFYLVDCAWPEQHTVYYAFEKNPFMAFQSGSRRCLTFAAWWGDVVRGATRVFRNVTPNSPGTPPIYRLIVHYTIVFVFLPDATRLARVRGCSEDWAREENAVRKIEAPICQLVSHLRLAFYHLTSAFTGFVLRRSESAWTPTRPPNWRPCELWGSPPREPGKPSRIGVESWQRR